MKFRTKLVEQCCLHWTENDGVHVSKTVASMPKAFECKLSFVVLCQLARLRKDPISITLFKDGIIIVLKRQITL